MHQDHGFGLDCFCCLQFIRRPALPIGRFWYGIRASDNRFTLPPNILQYCRAIIVDEHTTVPLFPVFFTTESHRFNKTRLFLPADIHTGRHAEISGTFYPRRRFCNNALTFFYSAVSREHTCRVSTRTESSSLDSFFVYRAITCWKYWAESPSVATDS